jgi:hypothetical protein
MAVKFPHHTTVPHGTFKVNIGGHTVPAMYYSHKQWCVEHVGYKGERWDYKQGGHFYFADEKDMTLFLLKWS